MNDRDSSYADRVLDTALAVLTGGVDTETAAEVNKNCLLAFAKQAEALRDATYSGNKTVQCPECRHRFEAVGAGVDGLAKAMKATADTLDKTARLVAFTNGKPDSRPELAGVDWLKGLTNEQFTQVQGWVEANALAGRSANAGL